MSGASVPNAVALLKGAKGSDLVNYAGKTLANLAAVLAANMQSENASPTGNDVLTVNNFSANLNTAVQSYIDSLGLGSTDITAHLAADNPHGIDALDVGMGNVLNVAQLARDNHLSELATMGVTAQSNARANLALGNSATRNVGTNASEVAAGDHTHPGGSSIQMFDTGVFAISAGQTYSFAHGLNASNTLILDAKLYASGYPGQAFQMQIYRDGASQMQGGQGWVTDTNVGMRTLTVLGTLFPNGTWVIATHARLRVIEIG